MDLTLSHSKCIFTIEISKIRKARKLQIKFIYFCYLSYDTKAFTSYMKTPKTYSIIVIVFNILSK